MGTVGARFTRLLIVAIGTSVYFSQAFSFKIGRTWERILVPDAVCGNGGQYFAYLSRKDPTRLAVSFMGGGACWDRNSCTGISSAPMTSAAPPINFLIGFESDNPKESPLAADSVLYFPYCTGDVHVGRHDVPFGKNYVAHQVGFSNVEKTFEHLRNQEIFNFEAVQALTMTGSSAGALGAMFHISTADKYVPQTATRVLIADSPGLHFGSTFWNKFGPVFLSDLRLAMNDLGMEFPATGEPVASKITQLCDTQSHWKMGFLQGDEDIVMSLAFGNITPKNHRKLVYGPMGLLQSVNNASQNNCTTWIHPSIEHTFMLTRLTGSVSVVGKSALSYVTDLYKGKSETNYFSERRKSRSALKEPDDESGPN